MSNLTISDLDELTVARLRARAERSGRSASEEACRILRAALEQEPSNSHDLAAAIRARFEPLGGIDLQLPRRERIRVPRRSRR
jgi:antitoxin FitA